MPVAFIFARPGIVAKGLILGVMGLLVAECRADRISLRGGGEIRGKLVPDPDHNDRLLLIGLKGKTPIVFRKEQIIQVVAEPSVLDEYATLRDLPRDSAQAEFELGAWCEAHKLADLATVHIEAALGRDPEFAPAHAKLGHVLHDGKWLDADGLREAQGLVKYQGRWITVEEKERREAKASASSEARAWTRRIIKMLDAYRQGPDDRSREAEDALMAIHEPAAVGPVLRTMGVAPEPPIRILAARVLGSIPGPEAAAGLVARLLAEIDETVRAATLAEVARRDEAHVVPPLVRALRSAQSEVVNRAAWALSGLNAVAVVPRLVPALISVDYQVVMVPSNNDPAPSGQTRFYVGGGPSIPIQTPAVVGNGSVAFGASSIPASSLGGLNIGLGGGMSRGPVPRIVPIERKNVEVLAALVKMTGRDFGYDVPSWRRWVASSFRVDAEGPTRRVPQP